jgi:hypothetical protein
MLCPLKKESFPGNSLGFSGTTFGECDQEKCAWWNRYSHNVGTCAIRSIALRLDNIERFGCSST